MGTLTQLTSLYQIGTYENSDPNLILYMIQVVMKNSKDPDLLLYIMQVVMEL